MDSLVAMPTDCQYRPEDMRSKDPAGAGSASRRPQYGALAWLSDFNDESKMKKKLIPDLVREEALCSIDQFNQTTLADTGYTLGGRFQGAFLYLDRNEYGQVLPICRLRYRSASKCWDFAIYKCSSERYHSDEMWFPGSELVDGTVEGAMKACMRAYQ